MNSVKEYHSALNVPSDSFKLQLTSKEEVYEKLSNPEPDKACGLDETHCRILSDSDGAEILTEPISQIVNMSLCSKFPDSCKRAKVRLIFTKRENIELKITDLFHFCL